MMRQVFNFEVKFLLKTFATTFAPFVHKSLWIKWMILITL